MVGLTMPSFVEVMPQEARTKTYGPTGISFAT
jgi:hypothetical protein